MTNEQRWGGKFRPYFHKYTHSAKFANGITPVPLTIQQIGRAYSFPTLLVTALGETALTGAGETVGLVELGGGYSAADLESCFTGLSKRTSWFGVDGGVMQYGTDADGEFELDIEIPGVLAPEANIVAAVAPNTEQGFVDAINQLVAKKVSVISVSWGGPEDAWTPQGRNALNQAIADAEAQGIEVCVAIGDNGATDSEVGLHVDFPGSSPFAIAVGGTALYLDANGHIQAEYVWNDLNAGGGATGGGVSQFFALPAYQKGCQYQLINSKPAFGAMRMVPDLALNASPATGWKVWTDGAEEPVGGTSCGAPGVAALIALARQANGGKPLKNVHQTLYAHANTPTEEGYFHANIPGNNAGYQSLARKFDCCTGLGSFNGAALLRLLLAN